jgi:transcriptional regulator with XRE-family HTH domain
MIMKFNERLKSIREEKGLTQQQLSDRSGVSVRTIQNYESGSYSPRFGIVDKLAVALEISSPELLGQSGMLVAEAAEKDGGRSARDMSKLVDEVIGMFAGGSLPQEDKDAYMNAISRAYFESKEENKKYTPKKYRK